MKKIVVLFLCISQFVIAQKVVDFDTEDFYYLKKSQSLKVTLNKDIFTITNDVFEKAKYNTANKLFFANDLIHFDSFTEIKNIEAYTENGASKSKVDHFETKDSFGGNVFFSDQQSINFVFPSVKKGAETTLTYQENIKDPHFLGSFQFGSFVPTKEAVYTVEVPNNVTLGFKAFNFEKANVQFEKKENKKTTTYTWTANNVSDFRKEDKSLSILNYLPHVIVYIKNYTEKGVEKPVLNDVKDLYSWYVSLKDQVDRSGLEEVFSIAQNLTKDLKTDKEKAKAIFHWVQENITYVAFEDGLGGFIPRGAASVCSKRYGDCKDMANILFEMLNHVGIDAHHTWIGTRDRPYSYYEVPTPIVDNHMITTVFIDGETIFLDATDSYVPFGMPSSFIQSKEALIGISDDEFRIVKVPIQAKEKSTSLIETTITLEESTLKASGKRTMSGYEMVDFIHDAKYKKDDTSYEEYLNNKYQIGNNKTAYTKIDLGDLSSKKDSYLISYDIEINNYARKIGSKIYLNLNLEKPLSNDIILTEKQRYGKKIDHKFTRNYKTTFIIPDGYSLKSIPENIANELDMYGFTFTFEQKENKLIVSKIIYMNTLALENEQFEDYNIFIKSLIKAYKKSIVLEKV